MKNSLLLFFTLLACTLGAQESRPEPDQASRFHPGFMWFFTGFRPAIPEKVRKYDRLIFDVTYNTWHGAQSPFKSAWPSIGLNSALYFDIPLTKGNTISIGTGLAHSLFRVQHTGWFAVDSTHTYTTLENIGSGQQPDRVLLGGHSLSVPFEFRFRGKNWKHVKFHIGARAGYELNLFSKSFAQGEDGRIVQRSYDFPDVHRLVYSAHMRFGIRNWALYASYQFNPLFANRESAKLNLIQAGLSISLF
jgi:hypothetical protein